MIVRWLAFDAYGTYTSDSPVNQIIDAFDAQNILYRHHQRLGGCFDMAYLATPRAEKIIKTCVDRYHAEKAWRVFKACVNAFVKEFPGEEFDGLRESLLENFPTYSHFDLEAECCIECEWPCPVVLMEAGRCPDCKETCDV